MLSEICQELKNWFDLERHFGEFAIENGKLSVSFLQNGQYFRIVGSVFNDGVYEYPASGLYDEVFDGAIWAMAVPPEVIALAAEIEAWKDKYQSIDSPAMSPYNSESFGGYSYSKSGGTSAGQSTNPSGTWQGQFYSSLNKWRKIRS